MRQRARYTVIDVTVVEHTRFGMIVATADGERGWVEDDLIHDSRDRGAQWPAIGATLTTVVMGYTADGRMRLAARPADVRYAKAARDPGSGLAAVERVRATDADVRQAVKSLTASPDGPPAVAWALSTPFWRSAMLRALTAAPTRLRLLFVDDLLELAIAADDRDAALAALVLASIPPGQLVPALPPLVRDRLADLDDARTRRLVRLLRAAGATAALDLLTAGAGTT
jgi:hypothetical protein